MRKLVVASLVTLDDEGHAPGGPEEDRTSNDQRIRRTTA